MVGIFLLYTYYILGVPSLGFPVESLYKPQNSRFGRAESAELRPQRGFRLPAKSESREKKALCGVAYYIRFRVLGFRFRVLGFRFRVLGFRFRVLGFRFRVLGFRFRVLGFRFRVLGFRFRVLGFRFWVLGLGVLSLGV